MNATSSTNLASDGQFAKYSRFDSDSDRVELLSAADYDPNGPSNYSATSSGYGRSSSSRAPRNIFDDLWHFLVAIIIALYSIFPALWFQEIPIVWPYSAESMYSTTHLFEGLEQGIIIILARKQT